MRRAVSMPRMRQEARVVPPDPRALAVLQLLVARRAAAAQVARLQAARLPAVAGIAAAQVARLQAARLRVGRLPAVAGMAAAMLVHRTPLILSRMSPSVARVAVV